MKVIKIYSFGTILSFIASFLPTTWFEIPPLNCIIQDTEWPQEWNTVLMISKYLQKQIELLNHYIICLSQNQEFCKPNHPSQDLICMAQKLLADKQKKLTILTQDGFFEETYNWHSSALDERSYEDCVELIKKDEYLNYLYSDFSLIQTISKLLNTEIKLGSRKKDVYLFVERDFFRMLAKEVKDLIDTRIQQLKVLKTMSDD
ncbi:hypothetical protein FJ364_01745 [Candidatus Dependentiae bacterium]|nr:hypothetical protein [Candidatus Dependentiae bacterium]